MKKRLLASLLALTMFTMTGLVCFAENETPAEGAAATTEGTETQAGPVITTGTQERAIENQIDVDAELEAALDEQIPEQIEEVKIATADDFLQFAENCKLNTWSDNKKIILTEDISLVGKDFSGIPSFGGIFDGQGHTIAELNINKGLSYAGLFIHVEKGAVIQNLNVTGTVMPNGSPVIIGGIAGDNYGTITECSFKGVVKGNDYIGGIAGMNQLSGNITFCSSEGFISGMHFTGGIVGENMGNIANCRNEAMVNTTNTDTQITVDSMENLNKVLSFLKNGIDKDDDEANSDVTVSDTGGIAGLSIGIIARCINNGEIGYEHVGYNVGGIAGRQSGYLVSCSNNGRIKGRKDVGGIVGQAEPYITVDLASDIAYQLEESISKLHDAVTATLSDFKGQSNTVSARLSIIQKFTAGAIDDTRYLATGTVDYLNGISSAANDAISRVDYVIDESSKQGGMMDQAYSSATNFKRAADGLTTTVKDLNIEDYMTDAEREDYERAKNALESTASQYEELYSRSYQPFYNQYINRHYNDSAIYDGQTLDVRFKTSDGNYASMSPMWDAEADLAGTGDGSTLQSGTWVHHDYPNAGEDSSFPLAGDDNKATNSQKLHGNAQEDAAQAANNYATDPDNFTPPPGYEGMNMKETAEAAGQTIIVITASYLPDMAEQTKTDAQQASAYFQAATSDLAGTIDSARGIGKNLAGRPDINMPTLSAEYKAHTTSLADNMQGMNDNFGILNQELNAANGQIADDLLNVSDQFNNIMLLYTDALDGVLSKDYTNMYTDESYMEAAYTTDATIDSCYNFGKCEGDIDIAGIAGTMAIEYEFDKESDITGIKDTGLNTSYITKCVLRDNRNYGNIESLKDYAGGICGLQEMGTVLNCGSYSKVESTSGNYVGGVAGSSLSYIVQSYAKGELDGLTYVGGVSGDGMHIKDCLTLVDIKNAENWYGAIAGHIAEKGEVRNNYFVSDNLAGIDRVSYALKAEPVSYEAVYDNKVFEEIEEQTEENEEKVKVVPLSTAAEDSVEEEIKYRSLPYEFSNINVNFVLEDEDLEEGSQQVNRLSKKYGDSLNEDEYPSVPAKEGYYVDWDIDEVDKLTCDTTVTATYKLYRTTLAINDNPDVHQSILLVDGNFKEGDELEATRTVLYDNYDADSFTEMEIIELKIPDDGQDVHQIRFKPASEVEWIFGKYGKLAGGEAVLYQITDTTRVKLTPTGSMGNYATYEIEGNDLTLSYGIEGLKNIGTIIVALVILAIVFIIIIIIIVVNIIKRHGGKVPRIFNRFVMKVSDKLENKEQLFYDDTDKVENRFIDRINERATEAKELEELEKLTKEASDYAQELAKEKGEEAPEEKTFDHKTYNKNKRRRKKKNKQNKK